MMKLSLMRDVFKTVNTDWDCELAKELIKNWDHDNNWVKMKRASANFICKTRNQDRNYIIRFNHVSEREKNKLEAELEILKYLSSKDLKVPKAIKSKNNSYIEEEISHIGSFHISIFDFIPGKHYDIKDLDYSGFYKWGYTLGKLHKLLKRIPRKIERKSHEMYLEELILSKPPIDDSEIKELSFLRGWLKSLDKSRSNYGLIHYDFELDNLIWNDDGIHIIDFDDSIYSWYIADIAYALRDLFDDGLNYDRNNKYFINFIDGYKEFIDLKDEDLEAIPNFYSLHNYISFKRLQNSVDIEVDDNNPEWLNNLVTRFNTKIENYRTSLSDNY